MTAPTAARPCARPQSGAWHRRCAPRPASSWPPPAAPPRAPPPRLCARRYARHDIYGLAAGLATSWAALAASSPARVEHFATYALLAECAPALQRVRPRAHVSHTPVCAGCAPAGGAPSRWSRCGP